MAKTTTGNGHAERIHIPPMTPEEVANAAKAKPEIIRVQRPNLTTTTLLIEGISPYVMHAFSEKARKIMEARQALGQQAKGKKVREPKDFELVYQECFHRAVDGNWPGIPAPAFRNAMISACKLCGIVMTRAKLSIFVEADGVDRTTGMPLVRIIGEPRVFEAPVRNSSGVADIRHRPMWDSWSASVRITWDSDQFSATDIANLLLRAGLQVGIGEGRPDSPESNGLGWGRFRVPALDQ
jgi:hypothetical protein